MTEKNYVYVCVLLQLHEEILQMQLVSGVPSKVTS